MMAFIGNREKNFRKYLERHFGISLPEDIALFYAKGVRIGNREIFASTIHGDLGYAACDYGFNPTNAVIQNFGHLAKKNVVRLNPDEAMRFASGKNIKMDLGIKTKFVVVTYKGYPLGLGQYESGKKIILNRVPEKRQREIINEL